MVNLLILIGVIALCFWLFDFFEDYDFLCISSAAVGTIASVLLVLHIISWATASYNYNVFKVKKESFEQTLKYARKNNSAIELAAITKEVSEWNQELAKGKYQASTFLLKDYVDKRILLLQPIK